MAAHIWCCIYSWFLCSRINFCLKNLAKSRYADIFGQNQFLSISRCIRRMPNRWGILRMLIASMVTSNSTCIASIQWMLNKCLSYAQRMSSMLQPVVWHAFIDPLIRSQSPQHRMCTSPRHLWKMYHELMIFDTNVHPHFLERFAYISSIRYNYLGFLSKINHGSQTVSCISWCDRPL